MTAPKADATGWLVRHPGVKNAAGAVAGALVAGAFFLGVSWNDTREALTLHHSAATTLATMTARHPNNHDSCSYRFSVGANEYEGSGGCADMGQLGTQIRVWYVPTIPHSTARTPRARRWTATSTSLWSQSVSVPSWASRSRTHDARRAWVAPKTSAEPAPSERIRLPRRSMKPLQNKGFRKLAPRRSGAMTTCDPACFSEPSFRDRFRSFIDEARSWL